MNSTEVWLEKANREMTLKGYSKRTLQNYRSILHPFLDSFTKHPADIHEDELKDYLYNLCDRKQFTASTYNTHISAIRFFYRNVFKKDHAFGSFNPPPRMKPSQYRLTKILV